MITKIHKSWQPIKRFLHEQPLSGHNQKLGDISFQPKKEDIFNVFQMPIKDIRVVILGLEPSSIPGESIGYSYATKEGILNTDLTTITTEITRSGVDMMMKHEWESLKHWREQGVFLLNMALTVETGQAGSHLRVWEEFTKEVVKHLSKQQGCIWLLWGKRAQDLIPCIANGFNVGKYSLENLIDVPAVPEYNYILGTPHPAAEAYAGGNAGFIGSQCFVKTNRVLNSLKSPVIHW